MANKTRFQCPYCKALFPVKLDQKHFQCPRCGHTFATVRLATHQRGWMALPQVAWERAHSQVIRPFPSRRDRRAAALAADKPAYQPPEEVPGNEILPMGAARLRRERRRKRRRAALPLALISLAAVFVALLVYPSVVMGQGGNDGLETHARPTAVFAPGTRPAREGLPVANPTGEDAHTAGIPGDGSKPSTPTATPTETSTPAATYTPTATPTPLPAHLQQATAWQATVEQAAFNSHATQTMVAGNYAATQTALPPTLTAMAQNRQATATQKAAEATARAAGPGAR
jgi:hypothetical protein